MPSLSPVPLVAEMDWPTAQEALLAGRKIRRVGWKEPDACFFIAMYDEEYLVQRMADHSMNTVILRGVDLRATDWIIVREQ